MAGEKRLSIAKIVETFQTKIPLFHKDPRRINRPAILALGFSLNPLTR